VPGLRRDQLARPAEANSAAISERAEPIGGQDVLLGDRRAGVASDFAGRIVWPPSIDGSRSPDGGWGDIFRVPPGVFHRGGVEQLRFGWREAVERCEGEGFAAASFHAPRQSQHETCGRLALVEWGLHRVGGLAQRHGQPSLRLPGLDRDYCKDAALRPQPKRDGPDDWTTPACLCAALTHDVLPTLPPGAVWEPAPGSGAMVGAIVAAGRYAVVPTDQNFLTCPVPEDTRIMATNPPFNEHASFIDRSMMLLDAGELDAVILLFRHDHLQSESRTPPRCRIAALNRATQIFICPWRPTWIAGTSGNGRWSNAWVLWLRGAEPRRPVWLKRRA
jgi:hypothetical protein